MLYKVHHQRSSKGMEGSLSSAPSMGNALYGRVFPKLQMCMPKGRAFQVLKLGRSKCVQKY